VAVASPDVAPAAPTDVRPAPTDVALAAPPDVALAPTRAQVAIDYDCLAPFYDEFTAGYAYEPWIAAIEERAVALGLRGRRALDIACGTGKSTEPLIARGYSVAACDISSRMLQQARHKHPAHAAAFFQADMRELPPIGPFDLVICLDDAINYLLSAEDLEATFAGVARVLAPGGVFAFDVNSLLTYRTAFAETAVKEADGIRFIWRGEAGPSLAPRAAASASVDILTQCRDGIWERRTMRHRQRHHPPEAIYPALRRAGLICRATFGQHRGARLERRADEARHIKLVHFAQRDSGAPGEVTA
jgi:SAM-dependent methyltransferase